MDVANNIGEVSNMNRKESFYILLKRFENWWNDRVPKAPFLIYTKNSYSHKAPRRLLSKAWSENDAMNKVNQLKKNHGGVIFFYEKNTKVTEGGLHG